MKIFSALLCAILASVMVGPTEASQSPDATFFSGVAARALATAVAPGIALAVTHNGKIVYERGFGYADVAARQAVSADSRFAVGSLTKQLTAAAIMLLAHEHRIGLDNRLSVYVPSLPNSSRITLRMLLDQNSGLHNYPLLSEHPWPTQGPIPLARLVGILATDKPDFQPKARWEYSNTNYVALTAVVEKVAAMSLAQFLKTRIFRPLHMTESDFGYAAQRDGGIVVGYANGKPELPPFSLDLFSGAGGAVSSAHDFALWDLGLMRGNVLPKSYLSEVRDAGIPTGDDSTRYTMGWVITRLAGHQQLWHNGLAPEVGGYCYNAIFPDDRLTITVMTNGFGAAGLPERMTREIAAAYGIGGPPQATSAATAAPGDDPEIDRIARGFWDQLASGNLSRSNLTPQFSAALTPALLAQTRESIVLLGQLTSFTFAGTQQENGVAVYRYALTFASGTQHEWDVAVTSDKRIAGSQIVR